MSSKISDYIVGVAVKKLSAVECPSGTSKQHEFNGVNSIQKILGKEPKQLKTQFGYLPDEEENIEYGEGNSTWYDSREGKPRSAEYRLYYTGNTPMDKATEGDFLFICLKSNGDLLVIITPENSSTGNQLLWLFDVTEINRNYVIKEFNVEDRVLNYVSKYIMKLLGIQVIDEVPTYFEELIKTFGYSFPTTFEFSQFARKTCKEVSIREDPDEALLKYLDREESLFRILEAYIIKEQVEIFYTKHSDDNAVNIDAFISLALSIINTRKSRAGHAFENHLKFIFTELGLSHSKGQCTERKNKPDFVFPGIKFYHDMDFPVELLTILGVKTSAKDRWRQILTEADRIPHKHMITLQPAITVNQLTEIAASNIQLVTPEQIRISYNQKQRESILNLRDFIAVITEKQNRTTYRFT